MYSRVVEPLVVDPEHHPDQDTDKAVHCVTAGLNSLRMCIDSHWLANQLELIASTLPVAGLRVAAGVHLAPRD